MEEILSSIKRIIAEEGDQPARRGRPARMSAMPMTAPPAGEEVLELSDPIPAARVDHVEPLAAAAPRREPPQPAPRMERAPEPPRADPPQPAVAEAQPIVSSEAAAASRGALETLSRLLVKPEPGSDGTLEGLVREMLRPMLREWLDANLPALVETLVSREIERIAGQAR